MAEPVTKKIDTLPAMEEPVATNDKLLILDVSDPATTMTNLITMNQVRISSADQLDANVVENAKIKDGAVTSSKLATGAVTAGKIAAGGVSASNQFAAQVVDTNAIKDGAVTSQKLSESFLPDNTAGSIELGRRRTSSGSAYLDFHSFYPINDYDARIISTNGQAGVVGKATLTYYAQSHNFSGTINGNLADNIDGNAQIANAVVTNDKLAAEVINDINKNLVYIQLFQPDEAIITTSAKAYFFVPSYLAGKKVKQLGIGIVSSSTGKTVTVALGSSYGSVSGVTSAETANTLNYTLPAALTKIPINVTVTSGTPAPKGLDLWFLVY